ncbi:MAG: asparaginase [Butyricicoccus sp.]|nr:asparaginase [Butyricicoccus sp.]
MSRVLIIYTGGTIGMVPSGSGFAPKSGYLKSVLDATPELRSPGIPDWELVEFDKLLDSSNVSVKNWVQIAREIERHYDAYDGFVVLHGTDTMAYTASALAFMLSGLTKPVILTGSQIPMGQLRSDARDNLISSIIIAGEGRCCEVCLYFGGHLLRGCRATKVSSDELAAFDSPNYPPLASADIDIRYNDKLIRPAIGPLELAEFPENLPIAVLKVFPGIQFSLLEGIMTEQLSGLVLEAFGVGNLPQQDEELLHAVRKAAANGTIIVVCTQCLRGSVRLGAYETSSALRRAGAVSGYDMTVEAAVAKLYYLFGLGCRPEEIRRLMETDLRGELTKFKPDN